MRPILLASTETHQGGAAFLDLIARANLALPAQRAPLLGDAVTRTRLRPAIDAHLEADRPGARTA